MSRVEKYKQARNIKKKNILTVILFVLLLTAGTIVVDYSINNLLMGEKGITIVSVKKIDNLYYKVSFMDNAFYINIKYISRDFENLKKFLTGS